MDNNLWWVYMLRCRDSSIYTGIAKDPQARYQQHLQGKGARYTRSHPPQALLAASPCGTRSEASKLEYALKRMTQAQKVAWAYRQAESARFDNPEIGDNAGSIEAQHDRQ